jgi:DNA-binding phage protein
MKTIQIQMEANIHMNAAESVLANIIHVSKFWAVLNEDDRDYIQAARHHVEQKKRWLGILR